MEVDVQPANESATRALGRRRKAISVSDEGLTRTSRLPGTEIPLVIEPGAPGLDLAGWAAHRQQYLDGCVSEHGAVLLRGFDIGSIEAFQAAISAACGPLLDYTERSSPRTRVSGRVFTSTDYSQERTIFLHNEQSYNLTFPLRIAFFCERAAETGGETPIADTRKVLRRLSPRVRDRFVPSGYRLVRNYGGGCGLSWQSAFQTDSAADVDAYCREHDIEASWRGDELQTRQVRPVIARHPRTGALSWFNHLTFFHRSTLEPWVLRELEAHFAEDRLPTQTYYADGSPIEPEIVQELREAYAAEQVTFPWRTGEVLLLDNMLVAHGRASYSGTRQVRVAMAQPCHWWDVAVRDPGVIDRS